MPLAATLEGREHFIAVLFHYHIVIRVESMQISLLKSKLHMAAVTRTELTYHGSISIPRDLMDAAGLLPHEQVLIANTSTGQRGETYVLEGEPGTADIQLNGAMARLAVPGDRIIVIAFASMTPHEAKTHEPQVVILDQNNQIVEQFRGKPAGKTP